jgi:putative hemolysin
MADVWVELVLIALAILANGFFAGSEIALVSARISRLAQLRQHGLRGAAAAMALKERPDTFLATIQIAITAVGTLASAVGGATAVEALTPSFARLGLGPSAAAALALTVVIVAITYLSLVLGELAPKALALRDPERVAGRVAPAIVRLSRLSSGPVRLLTASTNGMLRLIGLGTAAISAGVSEEEVRYLLRQGAAAGVFEKVEEELVHNVFEFADTTVREIMVPRVRMQALDVDTPPDELLQRVTAIGHTRIPVYAGGVEQIIGIVILKDLVAAVARGTVPPLRELLRPPRFVPETARISALLREFQRSRQNLAIVVDEYGGIAGLVTAEDVVEEIVGEIHEERESDEAAAIRRLPDGSAVVDGLASVADLRRELGVAIADSDEYVTVAGFIIANLGAIPRPGASLTRDGYRWTVLEMDGPRIVRVKVQPA